MASMEHDCLDCGYAIFNNSRGPSICPKCGGDMRYTWDEQDDYDREQAGPEEEAE